MIKAIESKQIETIPESILSAMLKDYYLIEELSQESNGEQMKIILKKNFMKKNVLVEIVLHKLKTYLKGKKIT